MLYLLMGISAFLIWEKGLKHKKVKEALLYFIVQLGLNFLWSLIFFGLHSPLAALVNIAALWIAIFLTMIHFKKLSKPAFYLLVPYLVWVSFASLLNLAVYLLN